jgi:ElaB/YqjD/DUF883 family membrane-anchored ribosome-binding protein
MKKKLASITERRHRLVAQAAEQREVLAQSIQPLHKGMSLADKGLKVVEYVKKHPVLVIGIAALIGMLKPTRAVKWLRRSWIASLAMRGLRTWLIKK